MVIPSIVKIVWVISSLFVSISCDEHSYTAYDGFIHGDILLTAEQHLMFKERATIRIKTWPMSNGLVTIPYYFDASITEDLHKGYIRNATKEFEKETCIRWEETTGSDKRHKVKIFAGDGCFSNVGMETSYDNLLSLPMECLWKNTLIHEMAHTVGLTHTQSRPDRDKYVNIWFENIVPGEKLNFDKMEGIQIFDVPYDYYSVMHYRCGYMSSNYSFTMSPTNRLALFRMGLYRETFRWSDTALMNKLSQCANVYKESCPGIECQNLGYVGKDCQCKCPENTRGNRCDVVASPFFDYRPTCGGNITQEQRIQSLGYGSSSTSFICVFNIIAPENKKVQINITDIKLSEDSCRQNMISVEVSKAYYGYIFCNQTSIPEKRVFISDTNEAGVYYFTVKEGFPDLGFQADIKFIDKNIFVEA